MACANIRATMICISVDFAIAAMMIVVDRKKKTVNDASEACFYSKEGRHLGRLRFRVRGRDAGTRWVCGI